MRNPVSNKIRPTVAILIAAFFVVFIFNLFRWNMNVSIGKGEMDENIAKIEEIQTAQVAEIEKAVDQLDKASNIDASEGQRLKYRRRFKDCVVLGDSLTEGLTVYNWLTESQVSAKVGGSIVNADEHFNLISKTYPKYAFFAFGMNDMGNYAGNDKAFIKKYESLLKKFQKTSKDTKICVCSISTPTDEAMKSNKSIRNYKKFNAAIEKMCKDNEWTWIDITDILPKHSDLYAGDGIHAAPAYYPLWMDRMIEKSGM